VKHSVVGARAVVGKDVSLVDCVVWDGVTVPPGHYSRAVIFDGGQVLRL
jgi:ADP-glucose pyrophosphorylase